MFDWKSAKEWKRVFRYYQAGLLNMAFGFGLYALFVRLGMNIYVAQILSHFLGMAFNYFTYSRYTFANHAGGRTRFILSYVVNYAVNLGMLAFLAQFLESPYACGFLSTLIVSVVNYFVLRNIVFRTEKRQC